MGTVGSGAAVRKNLVVMCDQSRCVAVKWEVAAAAGGAIHYRNPAVAASMPLNLGLPSIRLTIMVKSICSTSNGLMRAPEYPPYVTPIKSLIGGYHETHEILTRYYATDIEYIPASCRNVNARSQWLCPFRVP